MGQQRKIQDLYHQSTQRIGEKESRAERVLEGTVVENSPDLVKTHFYTLVFAAQTPKRIKSKKSMPRHTIIKLLKTTDKRKVLKADKWHITDMGTPIQMAGDFSSETMEGQKEVTQYFSSAESKDWSFYFFPLITIFVFLFFLPSFGILENFWGFHFYLFIHFI